MLIRTQIVNRRDQILVFIILINHSNYYDGQEAMASLH